MVVLTTSPPPTDRIHCQQPNTKAYIKDRCYGDGTLYIAEDRLCWVGGEGEGFSLEYLTIGLHAVSRDLSAFPQECLYLMLDHDVTNIDTTDNTSTDSNESDTDPMSEVRFVPEDKGKLDVMYNAMNECQVLHQDENEDEDDDYYGALGDSNEVQLSSQGRHTLSHLESIFAAAGDAVPEDVENDHIEGDDQPQDGEEPMDQQFADAE